MPTRKNSAGAVGASGTTRSVCSGSTVHNASGEQSFVWCARVSQWLQKSISGVRSREAAPVVAGEADGDLARASSSERKGVESECHAVLLGASEEPEEGCLLAAGARCRENRKPFTGRWWKRHWLVGGPGVARLTDGRHECQRSASLVNGRR